MRTLHCLIEHGTDVNSISNHGTTALHLTAARNEGKLMNVLINNGANVNAMNSDHHTPLYLAVYYGCVTAINGLIASEIPFFYFVSKYTD